MPLVDSLLKDDIMSEFKAVGFEETEGNKKLAEALAKAIVSNITTNALVVGGTCAPGGPIAGGKIT